MKPLLQIKKLRKSFMGQTVVDIDQLDIRKGEIISILGPSGCGKTTFLRLLAGLEYAEQGQILLHGHDISSIAANKRKINTVFQNYALFPHLSVYENIAFGLRMTGVNEMEIRQRVEHMLHMTQMEAHAQRSPSQISGGQKQRVAIARALVLKPDILLLDEPLAALDLKLRQRMLLELELIHDEVGITFIFITHDQNEAMSISDRIAVMNKGRVEQIGTPREIYESPHNNFVAAFIGDSNFFEGTLSKKARSDSYVDVDIDGLGTVSCYKSRHMDLSDHIYLGLRPEKIHLSKTKPQALDHRNTMQGRIEDIIYLGSQTKYWIQVGHKRLIVLQQHDHFISREQALTWNDHVWITWDANDGFILERFIPGEDPSELTIASDEKSQDLGEV